MENNCRTKRKTSDVCNNYIRNKGEKMSRTKNQSFEETQRTKAVHVTTSIPADIYAEIKASKTSFNSLILRAWEQKDGFETLRNRLAGYEEDTKQMQRNYARARLSIIELTDKLEKLEEVKK